MDAVRHTEEWRGKEREKTYETFVVFFSFLVSLMDKLKLHKNSCKVIDVTNKRGTVETLTETKISCSIDEKV